jgi:hypothetical protein
MSPPAGVVLRSSSSGWSCQKTNATQAVTTKASTISRTTWSRCAAYSS